MEYVDFLNSDAVKLLLRSAEIRTNIEELIPELVSWNKEEVTGVDGY